MTESKQLQEIEAVESMIKKISTLDETYDKAMRAFILEQLIHWKIHGELYLKGEVYKPTPRKK